MTVSPIVLTGRSRGPQTVLTCRLIAKFLFVPLAEAVIFAMIASYVLSRTLVPTLAMYLLKANRRSGQHSRNPLALLQRRFERGFEQVRQAYSSPLGRLVSARRIFVPAFLVVCFCGFALVPFLGQDFFPDTDSGKFLLHVRATTGTRIEETERLTDLVENSIRKSVPSSEVDNILDNIGLPFRLLIGKQR
jgi:multidrug efflux pump subunit AcrB